MRKTILILLPLVCVFNTYAQNNLQPEKSVFDQPKVIAEYYGVIKETLFPEENGRFDFSYLVVPSFEKEYFLGITSAENGQYFLTYRVPEENIWYPFYEHGRRNFGITEVKKEIASESARPLTALLGNAILNARFPTPDNIIRLDGTAYYFSMSNRGYYTATVWAPEKGTNTFELVSILEGIIKEVRSDGETMILHKDVIDRIENLTMCYPVFE